jgi:hypothetical protein
MGADWDDPRQMTKREVHSSMQPGHRMSTLQENIAYQQACKEWGEAMLPHLFPGALVFMFGGTRMFEWLSSGMQMAGFEHWETIMWIHAQGYPKAQDIGKLIDKKNGNEREVIGRNPNSREACNQSNTLFESGTVGKTNFISSGKSGWDGYKTPAMKPAWEPILCFRAPRNGLTYAELATTYGTGCLNVDGGRIPVDDGTKLTTHSKSSEAAAGKGIYSPYGSVVTHQTSGEELGRYPANLILDEESAAMLDQQSGNSVSGKERQPRGTGGIWSDVSNTPCGAQYGDRGGASRFFYCAKASKRERDAGCEDLAVINSGMSNGAQMHGEGYDRGQGIGLNRVIPRYNDHPCVKPLALTRHLAALLLPPASVAPRRLLAPFLGSGSEMIGALQAGWDEIVGIEQDARYREIAKRRIAYWRKFPPVSPERN